MRRAFVALVLALACSALDHNAIVVLEAEVTFSRSSAVRLDTPAQGGAAPADARAFLARFWAWEARNSRQFQHWYKMLYRDGPRSLLLSMRNAVRPECKCRAVSRSDDNGCARHLPLLVGRLFKIQRRGCDDLTAL